MNPILQSILVVAGAICVALIICSLIGAVWFAIQPTHEADRYGVPPLDGIPADREFTDPDTKIKNRSSRGNEALTPPPLTTPPLITIIGMTTPTATHPDRL